MSSVIRASRIAVVGIGCRFPGNADGPDRFWSLLRNAVDAIGTVPRDRFDVEAYFDPDPAKPGKMYTKWGGFIAGIDAFDADFFGISPREAARLDPQQRLLLEVAWEGLEDGGLDARALAGSRTGVFVGICSHDYGHIFSHPGTHHLIDSHVTSGSSSSVAANRISFFFDFRGPSLAVDTACSSSLTAVHLACRSLASGECDLALAGGVNVLLTPEPTIAIAKAGMLSPDGRCKAFDASANGYVRGEGAGIVVLKPLARAIEDGDRIYAVIRGTAINQDGRTSSITVPSRDAQESMLREALVEADVEPSAIQYVEAHGTGTPVGDPIEVSAIGAVISANRTPGTTCLIGSVKTNIGHLEAASGVASLIKTSLALYHREIPQSLHFREANPAIPFDDFHLRVAATHQPWPAGDRSLAAVNSFGFGGSNAHAIVEGPPAEAARTEADVRGHHILAISARSQPALRELAGRYRDLIEQARPSLADLCSSAAVRRAHLEHRLAIVANSHEALIDHLDRFRIGAAHAEMAVGRAPHEQPRLAFVFPGMGPQWWGMGRQLVEEEPIFRDVLHECDRLLRPLSGWSLLDELGRDEDESRVGQPELAQVTNLAIQVALSRLWRSWGIEPDAVVGHSAGEIAAAHVAGALPLSDALKVAFHRGRLQSRTAGTGRMLAVGLPLDEVKDAIRAVGERVAIAAVNSPASVTLSGDSDALEQLAASFEQREIFSRFLHVSVPYHGPQMELIRDELMDSLRDVESAKPVVPLLSATLGEWSNGQPFDAAYWWLNIRRPVRFATAIDRLVEEGYQQFVEVGPHPVLAASIAECAATRGTQVSVWPSIRRMEAERPVMLRSLAALYVRGRRLRWPGFYPAGHAVTLPTYPWQRERHWFETEPGEATKTHAVAGTDTGHPLLGRRLRSVQPSWETDLGDPRLSYLADHLVQGGIVYPGAAYVEMALAAGANIGVDGATYLERVAFRRPLSLDRREDTILQFVYDSDARAFAIHSAAKGAQPSWTLNATGTLGHAAAGSVASVDLAAVKQRCSRQVSVADAYAALEGLGLQYRGGFRGITELWQGGDDALGRVGLVEHADGDSDAYIVHPALLDSALQVIVAATSGGAPAVPARGFYLPVSIDRVQIHARPGREVWSHVTIRHREPTAFEGSIELLDDDGRVVVAIDGLRCKLVETTRHTRLDEMDDWLYQLQWETKPLPAASSGTPLRPPLEIVETFRAIESSLAERWRETKYDLAVERRLNTIVSRFIVAALAKLGWEARRHGSMDAVAIAESLAVAPAQRRFFARLLDIADAEQALALLASGASVEPLRLCDELLADYPEGGAFVEMMRRCGNHLAEILRGELDVRELLFSADALAAWEKFFAIPWYTFYNSIVADAVAAAIEVGAPSTEVRVLEIGAGTGGTTSFVLPRLSTTATEYWFTDISPFFLTQARQRFAGQARLRFHTLDIEAEPVDQGFEPHTFHVILAANVFHATADLRRTLDHVRRLLAPGGLLVLLEGTRPVPFIDLIFGVTEGWWRFADTDLRASHPLLDREGWRSLLHTAGFEDACTFAVDTESLQSVQTVILSRAPLTVDAQPRSAAPRRWLVFADGGGVGQSVAEALRADGDETLLVFAADDYRQRDDGTFDVTPANGEDMTRLLDALHANGAGIDALLHFWSLDAPRSEHLTTAALMESQRRSCDTVLTLLQAFEGGGRAVPDLWLITGGSQAIDDSSESLNVSQAPLWGFGRVLLNEQPHVRSRLVDLGPACTRDEIAALLRELRGNDFEEEVALRDDRRLVRRLRRTSLERGRKADAKQRLSADRDTFRLEIGSPGSLETLALHSIPDLKLNPDEIAIRVFAASPNFRDVMLAFGMLPAVAFRGETDKPLLGIECSGVVIECGDEVEEFRPGDEVIAIATGAFGSRTRTRYHLAARKPSHLTFEEATTIPAGFVTAYYAFHHLARLAPGERVLIHLATGGVGLAAIQLARRMGAVIFGTAGNPEKRAYLASMGIEHVMDSRSLTFAEEILDRTNGEGVDVVLNSLTGEAIPKGLSILRPYGRFVEIGKRDIYENSQVGLLAFNKNLSFFSVALDRICFERSRFAGEMLREMVRQVSDRVMDPLPHTDFDLAEAEQAFRYFAQAKHIGKVVLSLRDEFYEATPRADEAVIRTDATYLITGGLGGFGLAVADWLVRQGARHLVLMSRTGTPIPENERAAHALHDGVAHVVVARGDVCSEPDVARVLDDIRRTMPPLKGVFHLAGVLDDGPLVQLDVDRLHAVLAPKVAGGWNLHTLTRHDNLDLFVLFSSSASVFGNSAQANYAAANAFLDSLAPHRRALGLPALTINWGWLSGTGYISRHGALDKHLARQGLSDFSPEEALALLDQLLRREFVQVAALRQDWHKWSALDQSLAVVKKSRRLMYFDMSNGIAPDVQVQQESSPIMQRLLGAASDKRREILEEYMIAKVAKVLGGSPDRIDPERPLAEMGFDSLMAVELQVMLGMDLKVQIAVVKLLQGISIRQLVPSLLDQLPLAAAPALIQAASPTPSDRDRTIAAERAVDDESNAPVEALPPADVEPIASPSEEGASQSDEMPVHGNGVSRTRSVAYYRSLDYARWSPFQRLARTSLGAFVRLLATVDVEGLQHVPSTGAFLLASNHLSMIDGPVMWPFVPRRTVIFAGERWARVPLLNWAFDFVNAIYIRRGVGDRTALEAGLAVLQSGGVLGLAPEGTISVSGGLMEGRTGLVYLAHEAGVPIVPLVMYGQEQMGANLRRLKRTRIHIRVGPPISLTRAADPTGVKLREDTRHVMSALAGMLPPSYQGMYAADVQQT